MAFGTAEKNEIMDKVYSLLNAYRAGKLGGKKMPEDSNPHLTRDSKENYMYFTLPMALNYQRNSYLLWECANKAYLDEDTRCIFDAEVVTGMTKEKLTAKLVKYKVALQPNRQPIIWATICAAIKKDFHGDIRRLFEENGFSVVKIKDYIARHNKHYPYLGGNKIRNYWLYVMEQYAGVKLVDRENISVAPDTHVIQASVKLGVLSEWEGQLPNVQKIVAERWQNILADTDLVPIDVHTPMWLWSRGEFKVEI